MNAPVAVVVVNWNSGLLLRRCLRALAAQTYAPAQVLVVDNASTDESAAGVAQLHPRVRVLQMERNLGFAAASNLAARELSGADWLAFVNPDAFPRPDWLERLLAAARAHPDVSAFASRLVTDADPEVLDGTGDLYTAGGMAWRRGHGRPAESVSASRPEVFSACAAAALYRRDIFLAMGGFDESFFCYFEDVDLGFRLRLAGHRCLYVSEAVAAHVGSAASGAGSDFTRYHGHRNLVWTYVKNMPMPLLLAYLPQHVLVNACALVWFTLRGQGCPVWRAKWHALRALPRVWRERRSVQAARTASLRELMEAFSSHRSWLQDFRARRRLSRRRMAAPVAGCTVQR